VANKHETQETICDWAEAAFGSTGSDLRVLARANEEMAEAMRAETAGKLESEIAVEIGDVLIVLCRLGKRMGLTLLIGGYSDPASRLGSTISLADANHTMAKLYLHMAHGQPAPEAWLRELWVKLHVAMWELGINVQLVIDMKMQVNRKRKWASDGTGHGYHVREK
jgi:hypothetical protein